MGWPAGTAGEHERTPDAAPAATSPPGAPAAARPIGRTDADAGPLSEADFATIRRVLASRRPAQRAARTAHASAATTLMIGALGLPVAVIWPSWSGALAVLGLFIVGTIEYVGARRVRRGSPAAAGLLGRNQLAFLALIIVYCISQMASFARVQSRGEVLSPDLRAELAQVPGLVEELGQQLNTLAPLATYGGYSLIILLSIGFQGGLALYYFTRRPHLETIQRNTPPWVRRLLDTLEP